VTADGSERGDEPAFTCPPPDGARGAADQLGDLAGREQRVRGRRRSRCSAGFHGGTRRPSRWTG
jgi:hypothetical protein